MTWIFSLKRVNVFFFLISDIAVKPIYPKEPVGTSAKLANNNKNVLKMPECLRVSTDGVGNEGREGLKLAP